MPLLSRRKKTGRFFGLYLTQEVYQERYASLVSQVKTNQGPSCKVATGIFSKYILLNASPLQSINMKPWEQTSI